MGVRLTSTILALAATLAAAPPLARAEPSTSERAIAEHLFDRARAQLDVNEVSAACETFAESQRLDPGTGTALNLAACHQQEGKLASAWVEFREAVTALHRENRPDRLRFALDHLAEIQPRLAFVTLLVPESPRGHAPAVRLDGRELGPAAWSVPIPVDAGWHEAVAQSTGAGLWRATIKIRDGEHRVLSIPAQVAYSGITIRDEEAGEARTAPPATDSRSVQSDVAARDSVSADRALHRRRVAAAILGGLGLGAVGIGAYFGVHAASLWNDRGKACPMELCSADGIRLGERADSAATVATWTLTGGAVALGAAALVWLWSGSAPAKSAAQAGPAIEAMFLDGKTGLSLRGVF